jgi:hypothetical protein
MNIIVFPRHKLARCDGHIDDWEERNCVLCKGLSWCVTCGGAEGSMPSDCPGTRLRFETLDTIQKGDLDFRFKEGWVNKPNYPRFHCHGDS